MICRAALSRGSQLAIRRQGARGFAAAASPKASYEPTTIAGVKVAARDDNGPTTRLAIVAKAGTRYEPLPGLTVGLEEFAFKARPSPRSISPHIKPEWPCLRPPPRPRDVLPRVHELI